MKKIAIFGAPRSGTSWLSQIFNSHPNVALRFQPLFSYGHKDNLSAESSAADIEKFFEEILRTQDAFALMATEMQKNYPAFKKNHAPSHVVFKETRYLHIIENLLTQCKDLTVIGLVRNPLAVLASWVSAPKEFDPKWEIHHEWRTAMNKNKNKIEEFYGFNKWKESTEIFIELSHKFPNQFLLVNYADLNSEPLKITKKIFSFCNLSLTEDIEKFLIDSKSRHDPDPYSVFRANANDNEWLKILPSSIVEEISRELKNTKLNSFLKLSNLNHA